MLSKSRTVRTICLTLVLCSVIIVETRVSVALVGLIKPITQIAGALSEKTIVELTTLAAKTKGVEKVGKFLGQLRLSDKLLEDTYLRIAVQQGTILRREAEELYNSLSRVPGFYTTVRKIIGNAPSKTKGHLNELRIANEASKHGFDVSGIGIRFSDPMKRGPADIDVLLRRHGKSFAIEAKDYNNFSDMIMLRRDMDTLVAFRNANAGDNVIPVFTVTKRPTNPQLERVMITEAQRRGVQLLFGDHVQQIEKIKILESII